MNGYSLPKLDILRVPPAGELSYTEEEFRALDLGSFAHPAFCKPGFGGNEFVDATVRRMLQTPLDEETRGYRMEFFSELMESRRLREQFGRLARDMPDQEVHPWKTYRFPDIHKLSTLAERVISIPGNFEALSGLESDSAVARDLKRYAGKVLERGKETGFLACAEKVREELPPKEEVTKRYDGSPRDRPVRRPNLENLPPAFDILSEFNEFVGYAGEFDRQAMAYLIFIELCAGGCEPDFLEGKKRTGEILGAVHAKQTPRDTVLRGEDGKEFVAREYGDSVPNDAVWGPDERLTLITGTNSLGKSQYLRTLGMSAILANSGFWALADSFSLAPVRRVWTCFDFGDSRGAGHFVTGQNYVRRMRDEASLDDLILIDEPAQGTEPSAVKELSRGLLSDFVLYGGFNAFAVTHDISLVEEFEGREGVTFLRTAEYDDLENRYRILPGVSTGNYGMKVAEELGTTPEAFRRTVDERRRKGTL